MSNQTNNKKCGVDLVHDIAGLPEGVAAKGAFEAVFLGNVLAHLEDGCLNGKKILIKQQCKTQYPDIHSKNWCKWLTAVDQENQISLTHTLERGNVPILYNTPRLCDPGITMSKNWSLRNYIESRLYMFKYVYNYGNGYTQNSNASGNCGKNGNNRGSPCYPSTVFDFRPYSFAFRLPGATNKGRVIYVTQHITVDDDSGALGFTPHTSLTTYPYKPVKNTRTSRDVFKSLVKSVVTGKDLGENQKSVLNQRYALGPVGNNNGRVSNASIDVYINKFIQFLNKYDRIKFAGEEGLLSNSKNLQVVTLTDNVIRSMFYDLIHDEVVNKTASFEGFRDKLISEFNDVKFGFKPTTSGNKGAKIVKYNKLIGKTIAAKSYKKYGSILTPLKANNGSTNFETETVKRKKKGETVNVNIRIAQYPALFKTIGDLSQFMYAAKYDTIVGSGDKMGIAVGLYMNALNKKIVKCMIEDAVTGFIVYTGMDPKDVKFITKSSCGGLSNKANTCYGRNGATVTAAQIQGQMINSLNANQKTFVNEIRNNQKKYLLNRLKTTAPGLAQLRDKPLTRGNNNRTKRAATRGVTTPVSAPKRVNTTPVSTPKRVNTTPVSTPNRVNNTPVSAPNGNGTNVNNTTKRIKNLNAYLNNLQRQLGNKGNLNKSVYLSKLRQTNSNTMLANMKVRANANAQRISRMSNRPRTGSN
jgi:hypothetical protein